jgi:hypothetical protein
VIVGFKIDLHDRGVSIAGGVGQPLADDLIGFVRHDGASLVRNSVGLGLGAATLAWFVTSIWLRRCSAKD